MTIASNLCRRIITSCLAILVAVQIGGRPTVLAAEDDFFETKIRPVLIARCFECHSEQSGNANGGLQLDSREKLLTGGDSGPAISLDSPQASLLLTAIRRTDPSFSMPPTEPGLTPTEVRDFEQWLTTGAVFPKPIVVDGPGGLSHWAFQPIQDQEVPTVAGSRWPRNSIDLFLLSKLQAAGVSPGDDADLPIVARRLSVTLVGLPPDPQSLDLFLVEARKNRWLAISNYIDQLLASSHFGERWARHWMDLVRYAEGSGGEYDYEIDGAWQYRDYLVRAFNRDLPFNEFVREHIAGDLLARRIEADRYESLIATAWWNFGEATTGPLDVANDEAERMDNRLDVLGKAFTGVTVGCARCHDHKFDPLPTREYYGLFGVAVATPMAHNWANQPVFDEAARQLQAVRDRLDRLLQSGQSHDSEESQHTASISPVVCENGVVIADFTAGVPDSVAVDGHIEGVTPETANLRGVEPGAWSGLLSKKLPAQIRSAPFTIEHDYIDVFGYGDAACVQVIVANFQMIRDPIYHDLRHRLDGSKGGHWMRFNVGRWKGQRAHVEASTGRVDPSNRILTTIDEPHSQFGLRAIVAHSGDDLPHPHMLGLHPTGIDDAFPAEHAALPSELVMRSQLLEEQARIEADIPLPERFLGVAEVEGRDVPSLIRGDATKPRRETAPRKSLRVWADQAGAYQQRSGRLELADAIASPTNPLTARVFVNRVWQAVFGQGLVATPDNFGLLGESPSHPELLDYLAHRFTTTHNWSVKKLLHELVTTRAFQLASGPQPAGDPSNRLLSRYPIRRLDAESLRDAILASSGTLNPAIGGPSVLVPHDLENALADSGNNIPPSGPVDGERRRSIYLAARRAFPSLFLETFDRPAPLSTFGKRDSGAVPAQALTLLNDPFVANVVETWGHRMAESDGTIEARIHTMFVAAYARPPEPDELARCRAIVLNAAPGDSTTASEAARNEPGSAEDATAAGWEDLAAILINSKEFAYVP